MGQRILDRNQHDERLARRNLAQHTQPYFGYGGFWAARCGEIQTWAEQEAEAATDFLEAKKWLDWGGYQTYGGHGRSWRKAYRVKVRQSVRAALYRTLNGDVEAAEAVTVDPKASYLWDYW